MLTHCSSRLHYLFLLILTGTLLLSCGEKEKKKSYIRQIRLVRAIQISNSIPFNDTQKKLTLPASALITGKDSKNYVWVINTKTHQVHRRHITIGEQTGDKISILSGLHTGEWVVTVNVNLLNDGDEVSILKPREKIN